MRLCISDAERTITVEVDLQGVQDCRTLTERINERINQALQSPESPRG
ncbi:MAG: hypothetical protein HY335_08480 [Deinococcus sp.]|nr:hypothetical protein [Deinococcus sp.]